MCLCPHEVSYKHIHITYLFVVIFLPLTILVEVDTDLKLPIPLPPNDVEENEVRLPCPNEPNEVKPIGEKTYLTENVNGMLSVTVGFKFTIHSDYTLTSGCH